MGIPTYVDLILGLPMETIDSFKNGVDRLIENGCHEHIQFNNLTLLPNAEMSKHKDTYGLEVISAPVWSLHAKANHSEEYVREIQDLVISTKSLPKDDWRESRVFAWMASLIHLNKIAQPIILLARSQSDFSYRQIIDQVINTTWNAIICYVVNRMRDFALSVQKEGREYFAEKRYLGINWTVDELTFIDLVEKNKLEQFIQEIASLLFHHVRNNSGFSTNFKTLEKAFCEASEISYKSLILPGENLDESLKLETNVVEVINQIRAGTKVNLRETSQVIVYEREKQVELRNLDFDRWMREVVWYRNKRGAYTWDSKLNDLGIPEGHLR